MAAQFHEDFCREEEVQASSGRSFGLLFAAIAVIVAAWKIWQAHYAAAGGWALAALLLAAIALFVPAWLKPLNRVWTKFGLLLYTAVNPVVMFLLYVIGIVPIGLIMRGLGKNPLRLRMEPASPTYWISREPPGPARDTMPYQF